MRRIVIGVVLVLTVFSLAFAQVRKNAYQIKTFTPTTQNTATNVTFPYESRDIVIVNGDTDALWVDVTGKITKCVEGNSTSGCTYIPSGGTLELYDYGTNSINLLTYSAQASPVSVTVLY